MKTCETCEHYPDCKADPDCGELKVCEFWSNSPADDNLSVDQGKREAAGNTQAGNNKNRVRILQAGGVWRRKFRLL